MPVGYGQREGEARATSFLTPNPDPSAVGSHQAIGDVQTESGANGATHLRALDAAETVKDMGQMIRLDTHSVVSHANLEHAVCRAPLRGDSDATAIGSVLDGVAQEVNQYLHYPSGVGPEVRRRCWNVYGDR